MNAALTKSSTMDSMIGAYRSHILGRHLPEPAHLTFVPTVREIAVQPGGGVDLCSRLSGILVWACTLTDVTASWWHTQDDSLHVRVSGRTTGGTRLRVYGGGPFADCCGLVRLPHGTEEGVSLDELYTLVGLLRENQQRHREVA